jgi:hypothetical protein
MLPCHTQPPKHLRVYHSFHVLQKCVYIVIGCCKLASQLCAHFNAHRYCHFGVYKYMHTDGRSAMQVMVRFCIWSCRCMSSLRGGPPTLKQLHPAHRKANNIMANLPSAISHAPECPQGRSTRQIASSRASPSDGGSPEARFD